MSRVGLGRIRRVSSITGRAGSNQEGFKYHGSGRLALTRPDPTRPDRTREK